MMARGVPVTSPASPAFFKKPVSCVASSSWRSVYHDPAWDARLTGGVPAAAI